MLRNFRVLYTILFILILLVSCQPVHYFTRLKKTPREYTFNYCGENIKAPKSEFDKQIWVVFSDRDNNVSYVNPGGKVKFKEFGFMDPFLVLKQKGDYLRLVKYDAEVIHNIYNPKLKDRKKAEYCGWIHKSKLLLTRQAVTDISSGFKEKQLTIITNSETVSKPKDYFAVDSILTFKDENLISTYETIPFYNIVHVLKISADNEKSLISKKAIISPDSVSSEVLGWISSALISNIGQRLHVDLESMSDSLLVFKDKDLNDTLTVSKWDFSENRIFNKKTPAMKYSPISYYKRNNGDSIFLRTGIVTRIIDNKDNYVFNVNGNKIPYNKFNDLEKDSRKLNIQFVLEGHQSVIRAYAEIANVIQNLQPIFEKESDIYSYQFGTVLTSQGKSAESYPTIKASGLTADYTQMMDALIAEIESKEKKSPIPVQYAWSGVRRAVDIFGPHKNETNILVVIGGTGYSEWADSTLVRRMGDLNCRILGFQMHGVKEVLGNNFVLQIENMIETSANRISKAKKEKLVYTNQVKPRNLFRESSKNVYKLDFPNQSMSQGWILFPEKEGELPLDILTNSIDSLVTEVKWDNENIISNLYNAFNTVGKQRNLYGDLFAKYDGILNLKSLNKSFVRNFSEEIPVGYLPSQKIIISDSINKQAKYHLLLSKEEIDDLTLFIERLSAIEVDIKYKNQKKGQKRNYCNCADDEYYFVKDKNLENANDSIHALEYRSTRKLRKKLQQTYIKELTICKLCKRSKKVIKGYTLAQAQEQITGCPSYTELLSMYRIEDILNDKKLTDSELDALIEYFKQKKEDLMKKFSSLDKFESNGQVYYWFDQELLP